MDFVKFLPIELSETIFQHLNLKELLNATLVSKSWSKFIGESQILMKNIKIVYNLNNKTSQISKWKKVISNSVRIYRNVEFTNIEAKFIKKIFYIFKSKNNEVKNLKLHDVQFYTTEELVDFIELFSSSVVEIIFDSVEVKEVQNIFCEEMENLKFLQLISCNSLDCINGFARVKNLSNLEIQAEDVTLGNSSAFPNIEIIVQLLHQNEKLKYFNLSIYMDNQESLQDHEKILIFPFKLAGFKNSKVTFENFFLIEIQSLYLETIDYSNDLDVILKIPKLKEAILGLISRGFTVGLPLLSQEEREEISVLELSLHLQKFKEYISNSVLYWLGHV